MLVARDGQLAHVILWPFGNHNRNNHRTLLSAFPADILNFHVDVAVVLVKLADFVQVLFQLDLIKAPGFIQEINERLGARFHLFAQYFFAEVRISLEVDLAHRSFNAFVNCVNHARRAALLVNWIDAKLNADVSESSSLIDFDDLLACFLQLLFINRLVEFQFDFFA